MLMIELIGPSVTSVLEQLEIVKGVSVTNRGYDVTYATDDQETQRLWALRKQAKKTYQHILFIRFFLNTLLTHLNNTSYQYTLSTHTLNTPNRRQS